MKLYEVAYSVVKNVNYLDDTSFTLDAFVNRDFDNDQDYANSINNVVTPINEAIHRLSDLKKIKNKVEYLCVPTQALVPTSACSSKIKKIVSVFYLKGDKFLRIGFREFANGVIFIDKVLSEPLYIEYIEDIKTFSSADIYDTEIDLADYGISDTMCSYIIEYGRGRLLETIAPELANLHITQAEQYFNDLEEQQTSFLQGSVEAKYKIR